MNRVWLICLCAGLIFAMGNGGTQAVNDLFMNIGKDTFDFVVPLLCVTCFWNGILNVARTAVCCGEPSGSFIRCFPACSRMCAIRKHWATS